MNVIDDLYLKPLTPDEIAKLQKIKVPLWCSWRDNAIYIHKGSWQDQDPIIRRAIARHLGLLSHE